MTSAASLLMKDFTIQSPPSTEAPHAPVPPPSPPRSAEAATEPALAMFPVMPVADVLITQRTVCKACGSVQEATSDKVHRLLSSCEGDPFKRILRPRKPDEHPLEMRCRHTITIEADHCAICWTTTHFFSQAWEITPQRPKRKAFHQTAMGLAFEEAKKEKVKKLTKKELAAMPLDKALDLL
jgi:hypothetical protein